jgi:glutathione S-transferase
MTDDIILHHFDLSPFAEKIRLALGVKRLSWRSVQIPLVMPKPDLTALTGGYRKTPVMQIGADIYCDTQRIAVELERRFPKPSLFPAGSDGLALALSAWSDKAFFEPGAGLSMGTNADLPEPILTDRKAFFNFMDFSTLDTSLPHFYSQLRSHAALIERQLSDGRDYFLGEGPGWADILAYFPVWMVRANVADIDTLLVRFEALAEWEARIKAIGHGERTEITAEGAIAIARDSVSASEVRVDPDDPLHLAAGCRVEVSPDDYGIVPVAGALVQLTSDNIAIRRDDPRAGELVVHFPRIGYRVVAA